MDSVYNILIGVIGATIFSVIKMFYRGGSQEKTPLPSLEFLLLPAPCIGTGSVLTGRSVPGIAEHLGPVLSIFSPSGFHRLFATKPVRSETHKQNGCQVATMVLFGTRGPLLCRVIRGGLE